ncbi:MAG TPA: radical SAM protein, partial [Pseudoduganella sp.]
MLLPRSLKALKGRGAVTNVQGRYELDVRETFDDGWLREEDEPRVWRTQVTEETAKT